MQRPAAGVEGNWKHDMYSKAPPREERDNRRTESGQKSAKLVITNLHYEVSENELEVSGRGGFALALSGCRPVRLEQG